MVLREIRRKGESGNEVAIIGGAGWAGNALLGEWQAKRKVVFMNRQGRQERQGGSCKGIFLVFSWRSWRPWRFLLFHIVFAIAPCPAPHAGPCPAPPADSAR